MALLPLAPCTGSTDHTDLNVTAAEIDCLVNDTVATVHIVFRFGDHRRLDPWYNANI